MFNKVKVVAISFAVFTLLFRSASVSMAQTFDDVPADSWYFGYVEELASEGVIDAEVSYFPDKPVSRAELAEMIVKAIGGLEGYEAPATPTFKDVPSTASYYDFVEAAVQLGIVSGYTDAEGNLTGQFGPDDIVNRATATKILINALKIPMDLDPESTFPDVTKGAWYYDYAITAYNHSILSGYENGYFGSSDPVTKAQIAKLIVNARSTSNPAAGEAEAEIEEVLKEGVTASMLEVSLNDYQIPESTVPLGSATPLFYIDFTAAGGDVFLSEVTLTRGGVGAATDWAAIYAYLGNIKITSEYTINGSTNRVRVPLNLPIAEGQTTTITFYGDNGIAAGAANQHYFYINSAADVVSSAQSVAGAFPLAGNEIKMGSLLANYVVATPGPALSNPERGKHSKIASLKLETGPSSDVALRVLALTQAGNLSSDKMTDCRLLKGSDTVAEAKVFFGDQLVFVLEEPYIIPKGQSRNFYVRCLINGGRSTDTIQLYLDQIYDLIKTDLDFGYAAGTINFFNRNTAPSYNLRGTKVFVQ